MSFFPPDLTKLESLNMRYCNYIADSDIKYLTGSIISVCFREFLQKHHMISVSDKAAVLIEIYLSSFL